MTQHSRRKPSQTAGAVRLRKYRRKLKAEGYRTVLIGPDETVVKKASKAHAKKVVPTAAPTTKSDTPSYPDEVAVASTAATD